MSKAAGAIVAVVSFVIGMTLMWALGRTSGIGPTATPEIPGVAAAQRPVNPGAPKVELYVMSQCPYGVKAEQAFDRVVAQFGPDIDYRVEYIGTVGPAGELGSMHGPREVKGNLVQVCAMKHSPKWVELIACQNETWQNVDTNWRACADKLGLPADKIGACADGAEGKELLAASYKRAQAKGIEGSPTIHIGGVEYEGGRRASDLTKAICGATTGEKPALCSNIPEAPKVNVSLLGDKRCGEKCNTEPLDAQTRVIIANPVITRLDYSDPAGKKLFEAIKPVTLPAVIFDATLDADPEAAEAVAEGVRQVGEHKVVQLGDWNPVCADDGGCKLDACKDKLQCRAEKPNTLEVFVMSQCPYGVKGLDAMRTVLDHFEAHKAKIDFIVHFIGTGDAKTGLESMHGQPEVDENIRQICAFEHYRKNLSFMKYIWCRNPNINDPAWEACAGPATGVDEKVIRKCAEGDEGKKLLEKSYVVSNGLGMTGSPTWLVNGKFQFSGIDAKTIKTQLCAHNQLAGCDAELPGSASAPGSAEEPAAGCGTASPDSAAPGCGE